MSTQEDVKIEVNDLIEEYRGIVNQLTHQAAVNGALITTLKRRIKELEEPRAGTDQPNTGDSHDSRPDAA